MGHADSIHRSPGKVVINSRSKDLSHHGWIKMIKVTNCEDFRPGPLGEGTNKDFEARP